MFENNEELKLTYQELIEIEGHENLNEDEAVELIEVAFLLSKMAYNAYKNKEVKSISYEERII